MTQFLDFSLGGIANGAVIALMAFALVLVWRSSRVVNFAQVGQAMFTTFISLWIYESSGSWLLALFVAIFAGAILGLVVHLLVMKPVHRADASGAIIATFGVLIALQAAAGMIWGGDPKAFVPPVANSGLEFAGRIWPVSWYDLLIFAVTSFLVVVLSYVFTRTSFGLAMRASALNPEVARLCGVRVSRMLILGWALAGSVGAIAGVLIAPSATLSPNSFDLLLVFAFTAAVIGGLDSLVGAVAFGVGTGLTLSLVTGYSDASNAPIVSLALLVVILLMKPDGFFSQSKSRVV